MLQTNSTWFPTCPIIGGHTGYGDVCPRGYYCVLGSTLPQGCPAGTYQDEEGQDDCKECPEGLMTTYIAWLVCSVVHAAVFFFRKNSSVLLSLFSSISCTEPYLVKSVVPSWLQNERLFIAVRNISALGKLH